MVFGKRLYFSQVIKFDFFICSTLLHDASSICTGNALLYIFVVDWILEPLPRLHKSHGALAHSNLYKRGTADSFVFSHLWQSSLELNDRIVLGITVAMMFSVSNVVETACHCSQDTFAVFSLPQHHIGVPINW